MKDLLLKVEFKMIYFVQIRLMLDSCIMFNGNQVKTVSVDYVIIWIVCVNRMHEAWRRIYLPRATTLINWCRSMLGSPLL